MLVMLTIPLVVPFALVLNRLHTFLVTHRLDRLMERAPPCAPLDTLRYPRRYQRSRQPPRHLQLRSLGRSGLPVEGYPRYNEHGCYRRGQEKITPQQPYKETPRFASFLLDAFSFSSHGGTAVASPTLATWRDGTRHIYILLLYL
jgi:hypothetical protein